MVIVHSNQSPHRSVFDWVSESLYLLLMPQQEPHGWLPPRPIQTPQALLVILIIYCAHTNDIGTDAASHGEPKARASSPW